MIIFLTLYKPYKDKMSNNLEIFNEIIVQIILYNMIIFSDNYALDPELKMNLGNIPISLSLLFLLVNIYFIMSQKLIDMF